MTNQPIRSTQSQPETPPKLANDNGPSSRQLPASDNRFMATRTAWKVLRSASPWYRAYVFLEWNDKKVAEFQAQLQRQQQEKDNEADRGKVAIKAENSAHQPERRNEPSQKQQTYQRSQEKSAEEKDKCYEQDDYGIDRPISKIQFSRTRESDPFFAVLKDKGNSKEQESRLLAIYEQLGERASTNNAELVYREYMSNIALKQGRQMMDRAKDPEVALKTDQQAFQVTFAKTQDFNASIRAIASASPNMANLDANQQQGYLWRVQLDTPDKVQVFHMLKDHSHQRSGQSLAELFIAPPEHSTEKLSPATARDKELFNAEVADLILHRIPGYQVDAELEYRRQLGEQIRYQGREGISFTQEECQEEKISSDQRIARQMYATGYEKAEILQAIRQASSSVADLSPVEKLAYEQREITPTLNDPNLEDYREVLSTWRNQLQVPDTIKRLDCYEHIQKEVNKGRWQPERLPEVCPDDSNNSRSLGSTSSAGERMKV